MKKEKKDQIIRRISEQSMLKLTPMPFRASLYPILKSFMNVLNYSRPSKTKTLKKYAPVSAK
jgi:hypothetical protein